MVDGDIEEAQVILAVIFRCAETDHLVDHLVAPRHALEQIVFRIICALHISHDLFNARQRIIRNLGTHHGRCDKGNEEKCDENRKESVFHLHAVLFRA